MVGSSCTAELIQDDPGGLAKALNLPIPVVALELPSYQKKENWGASETFYQMVRALAKPRTEAKAERASSDKPSCNIIGPSALGFRHRDDVREIVQLLESMGVQINVVAPLGATAADLARLGDADFNVMMYPEIAMQAAGWMQRNLGLPCTKVIPIGVQATREFIAEVAELAGLNVDTALEDASSRAPWYSRSVDSTYLTGKRVFVFGDAREVREAAKKYGIEALITDDYLEVEEKVAELQPELVLGTQMERHIAKRLGLPCAVISAPVHVQDFPARTSPQMGFEGANVLFDTWVHPLMMGLEEHLLTMFREDFEFHEGAAASHLGRSGVAQTMPSVRAKHGEQNSVVAEASATTSTGNTNGVESIWAPDAEKELSKIPFFVRGKARRNTERYAKELGVPIITIETLYDAKAHLSRQ